MTRYIITEKAGRFVAGRNNTGVGTVLELTPAEAQYELTLGTLALEEAPVETAAGAPEAETDEGGDATDEGAPKPKSRTKSAG
ncbi:MAG: hypothetical protein IOC82_02695 [Aestuariivirga sp.]|uniref:hypothetical protein n=1 Tax=Aestuariivirga sp. TaxID=2650926 RepID=UPI0025C4BDA5|nr:hypothetical protein [Aestuariivirga sp.]MCA3559922.1 hypothetical protein [Aestuariivirga sp.]